MKIGRNQAIWMSMIVMGFIIMPGWLAIADDAIYTNSDVINIGGGTTIHWKHIAMPLAVATVGLTLGLAASFQIIRQNKRMQRNLGNANKVLEQKIHERTLGLQIEIEKRVAAQKTLEKSHEEMEDLVTARTAHLSAVFKVSVNGIITIDAAGIIQTFNPSAEEMFGYAAEKIIGRNVSVLMSADDAENHDSNLAKYLTSGKSDILGRAREITGRRTNGDTFPIEISVAQMEIDGNVSFVGNLTDISDRSIRERQIRNAHKMEALAHSTCTAAHEFNNLLSGVRGFAEIGIRKTEENTAARNCFDEIKDAADRSEKLTRQMLASGRKQSFTLEAVSIATCFANIEPMLRSVVGPNVEVCFPNLNTEIFALADAEQLSNALLNLAINANTAMPDGGRLTLDCHDAILEPAQRANNAHLKTEDFIAISVTDTGTGIADYDLERIYDPFYTAQPLESGSGLGLSIVLGTVEQSGGFMDVVTELGSGTTFTMYLARAEHVPSVEEDRLVNSPPNRTRALVVEGKQGVREIVCETLEAMEYAVLVAANKEEAVELIKSNREPIDILLIDLAMTNTNSADIVKLIATDHPDVKTVYMSSEGENSEWSDAVSYDSSSFIRKPINRQELTELVGKLFENTPNTNYESQSAHLAGDST